MKMKTLNILLERERERESERKREKEKKREAKKTPFFRDEKRGGGGGGGGGDLFLGLFLCRGLSRGDHQPPFHHHYHL